jgi:hypothetical protein
VWLGVQSQTYYHTLGILSNLLVPATATQSPSKPIKRRTSRRLGSSGDLEQDQGDGRCFAVLTATHGDNCIRTYLRTTRSSRLN